MSGANVNSCTKENLHSGNINCHASCQLPVAGWRLQVDLSVPVASGKLWLPLPAVASS